MSQLLSSPKSLEIDYIRSVGIRPYSPGKRFTATELVTTGSMHIFDVEENTVVGLLNVNLSIYVFGSIVSCGIYNSDNILKYGIYRYEGVAMPVLSNFSVPFYHVLEMEEGDYLYCSATGGSCSARCSAYGYIVEL